LNPAPLLPKWEKGLGDEGQLAKLGCTLQARVIAVLRSDREIITWLKAFYDTISFRSAITLFIVRCYYKQNSDKTPVSDKFTTLKT